MSIFRGTISRLLQLLGVGTSAISAAAMPAFGNAIGPADVVATKPIPTEPLTFERPNHNDGLERFAGHSSHASHSSHSSHYSGSGGGYTPEAPPYTPPPYTPPPMPSAPPPRTLVTPAAPSVRSEKLVIVIRVQAKLYVLGFYRGVIDGKMGPATRDAVKRYQLSQGLGETGALDDATLAALGINY